ncbi:MAG: 50S ribosomal protein L21 [Rhodospirillales bacterium]|nr:50S ribosomal protein L21 [Rhodospirillales bacterium]
MFAVIKTGGKQYTVAANDLLKVEKLAGDAGDMVEFNEVLMVGEGADARIGTPLVEGALVMAEVVEQGRARKVIAFKKRRRKNSKRTRGHRQHQTLVRISEILTDGAKPKKKAEAGKEVDKPAPEKAAGSTKAEAREEAPAK